MVFLFFDSHPNSMKHISVYTIAITVLLLAGCSTKNKSFQFIQISDPQLRFTRETGIDGTSDFQLDSLHLEQAVARVNDLRPAFVIITGDLVHDKDNEYDLQIYSRIIGKVDASIPVYNLPGNHDIRNGNDEAQIDAFIRRYGSDRFCFEYNGSKFIGLNSCVIRDTNTTREEEQFNWLSSELALAKEKGEPVYVFAHCPVFVDSFDEELSYHSFQPEKRRRYWNLFKEGGVKAMIAGHLHYNKTTSYEDIENIVTGPSGYSFEQGGNKEGFRLWTISPDSFFSEFICLSR